MKKIFAIFVNYNFGRKLAARIKQVLGYPSIVGVVVVDNHSSDESISHARRIDPRTKKLEFILNRKNLGFDKGVNMAIKKALALGARAVVILDADMVLGKDDFVASLSRAGGDYTVPVLKFERDGKWVYDYGGRVSFLLGRTTHWEKDRLTFVARNKDGFDFVSSGCTLIKKEVFDKIGFFDEDYFLYFGDTDHSLAARRAGFKVVVDPKTVMEHRLQEHKKTLNWFKMRMALQGNWVFINKWIAWYSKPLAYGYFFLLVGKVLLNRLSGNRF